MKKITLHLLSHGGTFDWRPDREIELEPEKIRCNDVIFPGEYNPHDIRLWTIGNEFGPLGAVWAGSLQDALDELVDVGLGNSLLIEESDADEDTARLGNAGEPADLTNIWVQIVRLEGPKDWQLMIQLAEARGANQDTLDR